MGFIGILKVFLQGFIENYGGFIEFYGVLQCFIVLLLLFFSLSLLPLLFHPPNRWLASRALRATCSRSLASCTLERTKNGAPGVQPWGFHGFLLLGWATRLRVDFYVFFMAFCGFMCYLIYSYWQLTELSILFWVLVFLKPECCL